MQMPVIHIKATKPHKIIMAFIYLDSGSEAK